MLVNVRCCGAGILLSERRRKTLADDCQVGAGPKPGVVSRSRESESGLENLHNEYNHIVIIFRNINQILLTF